MPFIYEDPRTGERFQYSRRGTYKKNGRILRFIKKSKGESMTSQRDFIQDADKFIQNKNEADDKAGYPPNCNEGYVEKDGKCVPKQEGE